MNIKKILVFAIIVLAVFSCLSVASAGLFDFLGGDTAANATYAFDGFTLDFAKDAEFSNQTLSLSNAATKNYLTKYTPDGKEPKTMMIQSLSGEGLVGSIDEFKDNWVSQGAKDIGSHNNWTILDFNSVPKKALDAYGIDVNTTRYCLGMHTGSKIILLEGNDIDELKKVSDTYHEIK